MKALLTSSLGILLSLGFASPARAEIITPTQASATSQFGLGIDIGNLINASGLDGEGAEETQLHNNNPNHMWFSGCNDAGVEGGTPEGGCADPFAVAPVNEQIVEFELDAEYELSSALVWQYNELNPGAGPLPGRGVDRLEVAVSPSLEGPFTVVGTYDLDIGEPSDQPDTFSEPAQVLAIEGSPVARRVRFNILSAQSGLPEDYVGLSEVRFDGTVAEGPLDPRVVRRLASDTFSDSTTPIEVRLDIILDPGTGPFTLDITESLPPGWEARDLTNGASVEGERVSWEITTSEELTTLGYVLVPDDATLMDVSLEGTYSFEEGSVLPTVGDSRLTWVEARPAFRRPPIGGRIPVGGDFTFTVAAVGAQPLEYQWEKDGEEIDGATDTSLVLLDVSLEDAGEYAVVVTNELDTIVSDPVRLDVTPPNLALCGNPSQSTTFGGSAVIAIDGNTRGESFTQTAPGDPAPWWELRLAQPAQIDTIVLWNQSVNPDQLSNFSVFVLDANREEVWSDEFFPAGDFPAFPDTSEQGFEIEVTVEGQIIRIEKGEDVTVGQAGPVLSLAEVEVFGEESCSPPELGDCPAAGDADFADTHAGAIAVEPPEGDGNGAYRVSAEGIDDSGDPVLYTFTARHLTQGRTVLRGPQEVPWAFLPLTFGRWELSVAVDDRIDCDDLAADAVSTSIQDVLDPDCASGELCNVALRGIASQSSTFLFGPELAIDGNFDGNANRFSVSHTGFDDPEPTWEVELDQDYEIDRIVLWNRSDCCSDRLTNFTVSVIDEGSNEVFAETFFEDGTDFPPAELGFEIPVGEERGRRVRVRLNDSHPGHNSSDFFLSLTEVEVYAEVSEICDNGLDDDGNGEADCDDAGCEGTRSCPDGALFVRGNADGDAGGLINITDGIYILNFLFLGGNGPPCAAAGDADDSGDINITDGIYVLNFLFLGGSPPPAPYPDCGVDPDGAPDCASSPGVCG